MAYHDSMKKFRLTKKKFVFHFAFNRLSILWALMPKTIYRHFSFNYRRQFFSPLFFFYFQWIYIIDERLLVHWRQQSGKHKTRFGHKIRFESNRKEMDKKTVWFIVIRQIEVWINRTSTYSIASHVKMNQLFNSNKLLLNLKVISNFLSNSINLTNISSNKIPNGLLFDIDEVNSKLYHLQLHFLNCLLHKAVIKKRKTRLAVY